MRPLPWRTQTQTAAIVALMLGRGQIECSGAFTGENCVPSAAYIGELRTEFGSDFSNTRFKTGDRSRSSSGKQFSEAKRGIDYGSVGFEERDGLLGLR